MRQYETTFIVNPVLSGDEIKATAQMYVDNLKEKGCEIVHLEEWGIRQLAYPINKKTSGAYFTVEFKTETGEVVDNMELAFRRDTNILRYLTVKMDKHRIQYAIDKRAGKFNKKKEEASTEEAKA